MTVRTELQEIDPEDWTGCGNELPRLRFRRVIVEDYHTPVVRQHLLELRARGIEVGPLRGDELDPEPGDTRRGVPPNYTGDDPRLCNARTRCGRPCRALALPRTGRCKWHGGLSTGPRTPEGKARALAALRRGREARKGGPYRQQAGASVEPVKT